MKRQAFSLVELSIVLVILGLLAGGILSGQALIRAAEVRSTITQYQRYLTAMTSFRDKYFGWPGDITNATTFWGQAAHCPGDATTPSTDKTTCDGDGDGVIGITATSGERFRAWQQMADAGLIEGTYNGVSGPNGTNDAVPGTNSPRGRMNNSGFGISNGPFVTADPYNFRNSYLSHFTFGAQSSGNQVNGVVLKPEEAWNIDKKLDDGLPASGNINAMNRLGCTTATATNSDPVADATSEYKLLDSTVQCALRIDIN